MCVCVCVCGGRAGVTVVGSLELAAGDAEAGLGGAVLVGVAAEHAEPAEVVAHVVAQDADDAPVVVHEELEVAPVVPRARPVLVHARFVRVPPPLVPVQQRLAVPGHLRLVLVVPRVAHLPTPTRPAPSVPLTTKEQDRARCSRTKSREGGGGRGARYLAAQHVVTVVVVRLPQRAEVGVTACAPRLRARHTRMSLQHPGSFAVR
eukprot:1995837-Rhodomonas_salina.2